MFLLLKDAQSRKIHCLTLKGPKSGRQKFMSANFQKMLSQSYYIILRIQRLEGKQCRSRWGGSLWATSSRSTLFANSAISSLVLKQLNKWHLKAHSWYVLVSILYACLPLLIYAGQDNQIALTMTELQIRGGIEDNSKIIFVIFE